MNRMKYLVRKYQRYLQKSSPTYNYKEKRTSGGSSTNYSNLRPTAPLLATVLQPSSSSTMIRKPAATEPIVESSSPITTTSSSGDLSSPLGSNKDLYEIKPTTASKKRREGKPRQQQHQEITPAMRDNNKTVAEADRNKTKPMLLQDLASSPEIEYHQHPSHTPSKRRSTSPVKPLSPAVNVCEDMMSSPPVKESASVSNNSRHRQQRHSPIHNITSDRRRRDPVGEQQPTFSTFGEKNSSVLCGDGFGITDRPYRSASNRSFNSLGGRGAVRRDNNNIIDELDKDDGDDQRLLSPPPKSYPRAKSDALRTNFEPTRLDNSNSISRRADPITATASQSHGSPTATHLGRNSSSQDDLKDYMRKLEDLQKRLKSQQRESHHRRSTTKSSPRSVIAVDGSGIDDGEF